VLRFPLGNEPHVESGTDVERINQFWFYELGRNLKQIATFQGPVHPARAFVDVLNAHGVVGGLLGGNPIPLGVSRGPAEALHGALDRVVTSFFKEPEEQGGGLRFPEEADQLIPGFHWDWIRNALSTFETVFSEEMRGAATYHVPRRGIWDIPSLVDAAEKALPPEIGGYIPATAKTDWQAAGRCLAFRLPTASGFHVARAVESTLKAYYKAYLGRVPDEGKSWGDYIADLEQVSQNPAPEKKTIAVLRQMKDDWRNPVVHPRSTLTDTDAEVLFNLGASVLIAVAQELKSVAVTGVQPSLTLLEKAKA
jgi:hypothetical protein